MPNKFSLHWGNISSLWMFSCFRDKLHRSHYDGPRDHDLREHIPHTWASSNDNHFQSNFSARLNCEAILVKTPDWAVQMT